ncbi:MAG: hypothetical protein WD712_00415 [Candidatus Spechtbacterales bacterium]
MLYKSIIESRIFVVIGLTTALFSLLLACLPTCPQKHLRRREPLPVPKLRQTGRRRQVACISSLVFCLLFFAFSGTAFAQETENVGVSITIESAESPPGPPASGPTTGAVTMAGKAYPRAFMVMYKDGAVSATFLANSNGTFSHTLSGISPGIYTFGVSAEDNAGRKSPTLNVTIAITAGNITTIGNIFMPPTIEASSQVGQGQSAILLGSTFPNANIFLFIEPGGIVKQTKADSQGNWQYSLTTSGLGLGSYTVRAKAITDQGEQSEFSLPAEFTITVKPPLPSPPAPEPRDDLQCPNGDLNRDGIVNLVDISIWIFYLNTSDSCADQNDDGTVDIVDLSIILYWWS